jgi:hypothetical protein
VARARDYYSPESGQWEEEFALAPRYTPLWLRMELEGTSSDDNPEGLVGVQIQLPPLEELRDPMRGESLPSTPLFSPETVDKETERWRAMLVGPATRKGYRLTGEVPYRERAWPVILKTTTVLHEGSPVGWYDLDNGFVRGATLWDLAHLKQGVPQELGSAGWEQFVEQENYEEYRRVAPFIGRPLWLLSEKQWDSAEFPPPIKHGPPFVKGVTAAAEPGRMRDMQANDYDSPDDALAKANEFLGAERYVRKGNKITVYAEIGDGYNDWVKAELVKSRGLYHWPAEWEATVKLPKGTKPIPTRGPLQHARRGVSEAREHDTDWAVEWINPTTEKRQIYFDDLSRRQAEIEARTLRMHHPNADVRAVRRGYSREGDEPLRRAAEMHPVTRQLINAFFIETRGDEHVARGIEGYGTEDEHEVEGAIVKAAAKAAAISKARKEWPRARHVERPPEEWLEQFGVNDREARDNPVDVADALPWVKVSRDPERYQEALKEAKAIGPIENAQSVYELLGPALLKEDQETFVVVLLDVRQQCRGVAEVHRGGRSRVSVSLIDVLRVVVASGAEGFVVVHNHPSGKASPSPADKDLTKSIERAAKLFDGDMKFVDHVICGNGEYYSFADRKVHHVKKAKHREA